MKTMFLLALGALTLPAAVQAQTASGTYNGHTYQYYAGNYTFAQAQAGATTAGGYLANITSQAEQDFVHMQLTTGTAWIGGSDVDSEGTWYWMGGPEAGKVFYSRTGATVDLPYNFWNSGEPNNYTGYNAAGENHVVVNWVGNGAWNDLDDTLQGSPTYQVGYLVEIDPAAAAVPEPASWAMMVGGFGVAGTALRRRRRDETTTAVA